MPTILCFMKLELTLKLIKNQPNKEINNSNFKERKKLNLLFLAFRKRE